jgi:hypothetical protein
MNAKKIKLINGLAEKSRIFSGSQEVPLQALLKNWDLAKMPDPCKTIYQLKKLVLSHIRLEKLLIWNDSKKLSR